MSNPSHPQNSGFVGESHPSTKGEGLPLWAHCPVPHSLGEKRQVQLTASGGSRTKLGLTEAGENTVSGWHTA